MRVKLQLVLYSDDGNEETVTDLVTLQKDSTRIEHLGLTLKEAKQLLNTIQKRLLQHQVEAFLDGCSTCPDCGAPLKAKGYHGRSFRTLLGTFKLASPRLFHCRCRRRKTTSFRPHRPWQGIDVWRTALPEEAWTTIDVRDGSKGPLVVDIVKRRVVARTPQRQEGHEEMLVVMRYRERDTQQVVKVDWYLSNGAVETSLTTFARVAKAEHRIEECLQRSKSEAGLADYEVRNWTGWHHHQTLSLIATWFLVTETRRGKKMDASDDVAPDSRRHRVDPARGVSMWDHATLTA